MSNIVVFVLGLLSGIVVEGICVFLALFFIFVVVIYGGIKKEDCDEQRIEKY